MSEDGFDPTKPFYHAASDQWMRIEAGRWIMCDEPPEETKRRHDLLKEIASKGPEVAEKTFGAAIRSIFSRKEPERDPKVLKMVEDAARETQAWIDRDQEAAIRKYLEAKRSHLDEEDYERLDDFFDNDTPVSKPGHHRSAARSQYELAKASRDAEEKARQAKIAELEKARQEEEQALKNHFADNPNFGLF